MVQRFCCHWQNGKYAIFNRFNSDLGWICKQTKRNINCFERKIQNVFAMFNQFCNHEVPQKCENITKTIVGNSIVYLFNSCQIYPASFELVFLLNLFWAIVRAACNSRSSVLSSFFSSVGICESPHQLQYLNFFSTFTLYSFF